MDYEKVGRIIDKCTTVEYDYGHGAFGEPERYKVNNFNQYKFAEEIIKECIDICRIQREDNKDTFVEAIGNHFKIN